MEMRSKKFTEIHADVGLFAYDCSRTLFHLSRDVLTRFNLDSNLDWNLGWGLVVGWGGARALMQIIWECEWAQDRCKGFLFGQTWVFLSLLDFIRPGLAGLC